MTLAYRLKRWLFGDDAVRETYEKECDLTVYEITYVDGDTETVRGDWTKTDGAFLHIYERSDDGWAGKALINELPIMTRVNRVSHPRNSKNVHHRESIKKYEQVVVGTVTVRVEWDWVDGIVSLQVEEHER